MERWLRLSGSCLRIPQRSLYWGWTRTPQLLQTGFITIVYINSSCSMAILYLIFASCLWSGSRCRLALRGPAMRDDRRDEFPGISFSPQSMRVPDRETLGRRILFGGRKVLWMTCHCLRGFSTFWANSQKGGFPCRPTLYSAQGRRVKDIRMRGRWRIDQEGRAISSVREQFGIRTVF